MFCAVCLDSPWLSPQNRLYVITSKRAGVAPSGVIQGRERGAGSEGIGNRDPLRFALWAGWQRVSCFSPDSCRHRRRRCWCRPCEGCVAACAVDGLDHGCDVRRASDPDVRVKVHRFADREAARTSHPTGREATALSSLAALRSKPPLPRRSHPVERYVARIGSNGTAPAATPAATPDTMKKDTSMKKDTTHH